ncbi:MAG: hypothetical protein ABFC56_08585 [Clostridiaceae bacterium]|nr:hypothetical protein [Eubacteriales bacterium]
MAAVTACEANRPVDEHGQIIIDYSIYDAVHVGFSKVICVIKPEMEAAFREVIGNRISPFVTLHYAYQRLGYFTCRFQRTGRPTKPLGTVYAVLCANF